jgi:uncharacterized membrane protein
MINFLKKICYIIHRIFFIWDNKIDGEKKNLIFSASLFFGIFILGNIMLAVIFFICFVRWFYISGFFSEWMDEEDFNKLA